MTPDDPSSVDVALGLLVLIGVGAIVALGSGWYPDLQPGTWAQWVSGIAAVIVIFLALFGDWLRNHMFGPKLEVAVSTEPPDCVRVEGFSAGNPGNPVDTVYLRIRVFNNGRQLAKDVQVFAERVEQQISGQGWEPVKTFPSMNLVWSDLPDKADVKMRMFFPGLGPTMSKHCDLGRIVFHRHRPLVGELRPGLRLDHNAFAFETVVKPNHQGHIVGPGTYRIRLLLAAENARPAVRTIQLDVRPDWSPHPTAMLAIKVI